MEAKQFFKKNKKIILSVAAGVYCLYVAKKIFANISPGIDEPKFKRISRNINSELPYKLCVVHGDSFKKLAEGTSFKCRENFDNYLKSKIQDTQEFIREICAYFSVSIEEYKGFFNNYYNKHYLEGVLSSQRPIRPAYVWSEKFTYRDYANILSQYIIILKEYLDSGDYDEFLYSENLLFEEVWKKFKLGQSELRGACYKYSDKPPIKKRLAKINELKKKISI